VSKLQKSFSAADPIGVLPLRLALFATFFFHGTQKLFGWFGGPGLEGASGFMESLGIPFPYVAALLVAVIETAGGVSFLIGAGFRFFGLLLTANMIGAILLVHLKNGWDFTQGGIEFNMALIAMCWTVMIKGPGIHSLEWADEEGAAPEAIS
jgi:putative oxidoreductase